MGNLRSVGKALEHVGAEPFLTATTRACARPTAIVLPGVGAMPKAMERVRELALDQLLRERVEASVPVIGLCMGMQLLFESTTELGGAEGIGLLRGPVEALDAPGLKVPQIGWNPVELAAREPAHRGPAVAVRLLPRELVRAAAGGRRRRARHRRVRRASSSAWSSGRPCTASSRIRRSPGRTGCAS